MRFRLWHAKSPRSKLLNLKIAFFLNKVKTLGTNFKVSDGGKEITVNDGTNDIKYEFEKKITGLAGIYKNKDGAGTTNEYIFVFPLGNEAHTVSVSEKEKKALEDIINIIGEENSGSIIQEILTNDKKLNADNIAGNFPDKIDDIQNVINNLYKDNDKDKFGSYKKYS